MSGGVFWNKRKETERKRHKSGAGAPDKPIADIWPLETIPKAASLMEEAFMPDRIDNTQIYETLVAGPAALDWWWSIVLTGKAP